MSRLSRKQMKRNEMVETVGSVVDYTRSHTRTLLWAVVAAVAIAVLVAGLLVWRAQRGAGAAAALAERINANMVIYGNLSQADGQTTFAPEFYIAVVKDEADEMVGPHQLGSSVRLQLPIDPNDQLTSGDLRRKLGPRTDLLIWFNQGLVLDLLGAERTGLGQYSVAGHWLTPPRSGDASVQPASSGRLPKITPATPVAARTIQPTYASASEVETYSANRWYPALAHNQFTPNTTGSLATRWPRRRRRSS